jgi:hypothetical protein
VTQHKYPFSTLIGDYIRAAAGLVLTAGPILFTPPSSTIGYILGGLAILFFAYGLRTFIRHRTVLEVSAMGIRAVGPMKTTIRWADLEDVDLRYYSTNRDRTGGWMQLGLKGNGRTLSTDSSLSDFRTLVQHVVNGAQAHGLTLTQTTRANLDALGSTGESVAQRRWSG